MRLNGQDVHWPSASARDLLLVLLSSPEGRSRHDLLAALWPDDQVEGASPGNRFRVTLHRLRTALGRPDAVLEQFDRYLLNPEVSACSDVARFHAALDAAGHARAPGEKRTALQRAVQTYRGAYLPDHAAEWAAEARAEHTSAYVRATLELSMLHCAATECDLAVRHLAQALRADPLIGENHHQDLMTCLARVEGKYAAVEHYRRFLKRLRDDLADTPMRETSDLAERLKAGEAVCPRRIGTTVRCSGPFAEETPLLVLQADPDEVRAALQRSQLALNLANVLQSARTLEEVSRAAWQVLGDALHLTRLEIVPSHEWAGETAPPGTHAVLFAAGAAHRLAEGTVPILDAHGDVTARLLVARTSQAGAWTPQERALLAQAARTLGFALRKPDLRTVPA